MGKLSKALLQETVGTRSRNFQWGAQGPAGLKAHACQGFSRKNWLLFWMNQPSCFWKPSPTLLGSADQKAFSCLRRLPAGWEGQHFAHWTTVFTECYIITTQNNGLFSVVLLSCAPCCSENTIRPASHLEWLDTKADIGRTVYWNLWDRCPLALFGAGHSCWDHCSRSRDWKNSWFYEPDVTSLRNRSLEWNLEKLIKQTNKKQQNRTHTKLPITADWIKVLV